jgi:hypothetical protein
MLQRNTSQKGPMREFLMRRGAENSSIGRVTLDQEFLQRRQQ